MKKNMKAIFIVSILFIIGVGIFGLANGNLKFGRNNSKYGSLSNDFKKSNEENESAKVVEQTKEEELADTNDKNEVNNSTQSMQSNMSDDTSVPDSKEVTQTEEDAQEYTLFATDELSDEKAKEPEKTEKEQYIERLNSITIYYDDLWSRTDSFSMVDMKELKNQEYTKWDDELNTIYQLIKKKLPEDKFIVLRDEEREWITRRDEQAALASSKYAGGSMESLEYMAVMTQLTKERTYELVDIYFEE